MPFAFHRCFSAGFKSPPSSVLSSQHLKQPQLSTFDFIALWSYFSCLEICFHFLCEEPLSSLFLCGVLLQTFGCYLCIQPLAPQIFFFKAISYFFLFFCHLGALWQPSPQGVLVARLCQLCGFFLHLFQTFLSWPVFSWSIYFVSARRCLSASTSLQGYGRLSLSCLALVSFWCSVCLWRNCISSSCPSNSVTNSITFFSSQILWLSVLRSFSFTFL